MKPRTRPPLWWMEYQPGDGDIVVAEDPAGLAARILGSRYPQLDESEAYAARHRWLCEAATAVQQALVDRAAEDGRLDDATPEELGLLLSNRLLPPPDETVQWGRLDVQLVVVSPIGEPDWRWPRGTGVIVVGAASAATFVYSLSRLGLVKFGDLTAPSGVRER